jgi:hypothetical protein
MNAMSESFNQARDKLVDKITDAACHVEEDEHNCEKAWRAARAECRELIRAQQEEDAGRKRPIPKKGITGGYKDVESCARGLVPERCGGNAVDWGDKP